MTQATACLNDEQIDSLLQGHLTPREGSLAEEHLEACEQCRARVEETIGPGQWWTELQSVLGDSSDDRHAARENAGVENPTTSKLLDLLGPTDDPNMLGRIGSYEIVGLLGSGGMGAVFKGFDRSLHRFVAIKLMLPHLASSAAARRRFAREGQAVAAVVDDHVMPIHCVDEWRGVPYLVMTYSRGVSLQKRLSDDGPLELQEILRIGMQTAKGLAAAHAQGIVHRDVKPANIFLDRTVERVQLMDFGLARAVDDASLTRTGALAGTPQYMSPEQARGEAVDHRSDLFSLGSVMYALCIGRAPFRAESSYGILRLITDKEPRPIRELRPELPEWLNAIIGRLMAKRPDDRYSSAAEVAALLEKCLAHVQQPATVPLPDSLRRATANRNGRSSVRRVVVMAASAFLIVLAGVFIVLELSKGTLSIESEVDDIPIRITQSEETVDKLTVSKSGKSLRVAAGQYLVELEGAVEGVRIENHRIELTRGGRSVVKIVKRDAGDGNPGVSELGSEKPNAGGKKVARDTPSLDPLAAAVDRFNQELRRKHPVQEESLTYPPLTKDELIACASWHLRDDDRTASVRELLTAIAQRHQLPDEWSLEEEFVELPPAGTPARAFRIDLRKKGTDNRFTVRERRYLAPTPESQPRDSQEEAKGERSLAGAIKRFNARNSRIDGKKQPPLTEGEVLASIFYERSRRDEHDVSDALFERFQAITSTGLLPQGAEIEVIPTFGTGEDDVYKIWSIRLKLLQDEAGKEGWTYAFVVREQFVSVKHGNAGEIHWGAPADNGLQAGVRLHPPLKNFSIGQKVDVTICYRNVLTKPLGAGVPNFLDYDLNGRDALGKELDVIKPEMKVVGGARSVHFDNEPTSCRATPLVFSDASDRTKGQVEATDRNHVIALVEAGKTYRLRFGVSNVASENSERLHTGEIEIAINERVAEEVAETTNSDAAILATIAAKQLHVVFESSDSIDVTRAIKVLGKQGGVEIHSGSSTFIELARPTKEMGWHAGDAPEVIGDPDLPEPFTHVWCRWRKDGAIRWTCYRGAKNMTTDGDSK